MRSAKEFAEDVVYGARSVVRTRSVTLGPVRIMPVEAYRQQLRTALEIGQEQGAPTARLASVRHLHPVREAQG